jgi:hypothetical protein
LQRSEDHNTTRAAARLPGLDIEIVHRRSSAADAEQISIHLQATPSFEAFGGLFGNVNPWTFWMQAAQLAWLPWVSAARVFMLPGDMIQSPPTLPEA